METKKIILTRGIQASGKSTWAVNWVKEDPLNRIRYNNDALRDMSGVYWPENSKALKKREDIIYKEKKNWVWNCMLAGYDIVIDNMNFNPKEKEFVDNLIKEFNENNSNDSGWVYSVEYKNFFIPVEECIRRDAMRPNPIGAKTIKDTHRRYRDTIASILNYEYVESLKKNDENKKNCIIVDIDATLCFNTNGRPYFGAGAAEGMKDDLPCMQTIDLVNRYLKDPDTAVIILTGREDSTDIRTATENWLKEHLDGTPDKILLRPLKNYSSGQDCKYKMYQDFIEPYYNVLFVLEDSTKVVNMWREHGLICLQCNDGVL